MSVLVCCYTKSPPLSLLAGIVWPAVTRDSTGIVSSAKLE